MEREEAGGSTSSYRQGKVLWICRAYVCDMRSSCTASAFYGDSTWDVSLGKRATRVRSSPSPPFSRYSAVLNYRDPAPIEESAESPLYGTCGLRQLSSFHTSHDIVPLISASYASTLTPFAVLSRRTRRRSPRRPSSLSTPHSQPALYSARSRRRRSERVRVGRESGVLSGEHLVCPLSHPSMYLQFVLFG